MYGQAEPDYGSALMILQPSSTEDLKKMLNEDDRLDDMVKELPQIRNVEVEKEMLMASNKSLAEFNLSREPRLRQARQRLIDSYQKASEDFRVIEGKKQQLEELARQTSLDTTLAILQTSAAQTEEETEATAEKFLEGNLDVEMFLEEFLPQRKLAHLRRVKVDKLSELIQRNQNQQQQPPLPPHSNHSWSVGSGGLYGGQASVRMPIPPGYGQGM